MTPKEILDLPMGTNDANAKTVREYLVSLLLTLWSEGEGFSGKRPFGNSNWEYELYFPLIKSGAVSGDIDNGEVIIDQDARRLADQLIHIAIKQLGAV